MLMASHHEILSALGASINKCALSACEGILLCVYQAVQGPLIPLMPLDTVILHSLLQLVKNVILVFAFVFSHEAGKLLLQCLPGNLTGAKYAKYKEGKGAIRLKPLLDLIVFTSSTVCVNRVKILIKKKQHTAKRKEILNNRI